MATPSDHRYTIHQGHCIAAMQQRMEPKSVHCCVTSPPYFGLRDYGHVGQVGLEKTPELYIANIVEVFRNVHRVLRDDGTLWLNLGDSYASDVKGSGGAGKSTLGPKRDLQNIGFQKMTPQKFSCGVPPKNLIGIPWRVALALQADGWYLRQDIIWHKPNPMPESVTDRCTKAHEYLFLLSKSEKYYFDSAAIQEPAVSPKGPGNKHPYVVPGEREGENANIGGGLHKIGPRDTRNRRSVWTVVSKPYKGAHFAVFPPDMVRPCIRAGAPINGVVLDPFGGSGTTGQVAIEEYRRAVLCELNPEYVELAHQRIRAALIADPLGGLW